MIKYAISAVGDFNFFSMFLIFLGGIGLVYFIDFTYNAVKKKRKQSVSRDSQKGS